MLPLFRKDLILLNSDGNAIRFPKSISRSDRIGNYAKSAYFPIALFQHDRLLLKISVKTYASDHHTGTTLVRLSNTPWIEVKVATRSRGIAIALFTMSDCVQRWPRRTGKRNERMMVFLNPQKYAGCCRSHDLR